MKKKGLFQIYVLTAALAQAGTAYAQTSFPAETPIPSPRPLTKAFAGQSPMQLVLPEARPSNIDPVLTSSFARIDNPAAIGNTLKSGLDAVENKKLQEAIRLRNTMPQGSLDRQILSWSIASSSSTELTRAEILMAMEDLAGWPSMNTLKRNSERALARENATAANVITSFDSTQPLTTEGILSLARAYKANGLQDKAIQLLAPWWASQPLPLAAEQKIFADFSDILTPADHRQRFIHALYNNRLQSAKFLAPHVKAQSLYAAFAAVSQKLPETNKTIDSVDPAWRSSSAYLFLKIRHLRRTGQYDDAAELMLTAPTQPSSLGDPDAWWDERRILSRELLDVGKPDLAYKLAAAHAAETPAMAAEAEFHAGWYALRSLNKPKLAASHFAKIADISARPISASRAYYWLGRATEAGAEGNAQDYYQRAARFGTTFYGQLAAAKLGEKTPELSQPVPTNADRVRFSGRPAVQAIMRLNQIGYERLTSTLYIQLSYALENREELMLLAGMAADSKNHYLALRIGKIAALRGFDVGTLSHPLGAIPPEANISGAGKALAYAIARQESEFNTGAVSHAGARGLLQLMPETAKSTAGRNDIPYSLQKLTTDAAYNATLGAHFLGEQLERFNGSYVLTFAGYNAGPRRTEQWIEKYGDPRGKSIDEVIDWIERIPFSETRNYVQRVMENYEVYKARLTGNADIGSDLVYGRR